jgi:hypothetical protein
LWTARPRECPIGRGAAHDAWHIATHVDARLWQTLLKLLLRPGRLTRECFADHRARYLPPVRVYLVLSVLFFSLGPLSADNRREVAPTPKDAPAAESSPKHSHHEDEEDYDISGALDCAKTGEAKSLSERLVQNGCRHTRASAKAAFLHNLPKMMFVFVPLMALVMLLLYWRPRRFYVEHLVFFLHNHAAMFLILIIEALLGAIAKWRGWKVLAQWVIALTCLYAVWYVYRAMRLYYGQGRGLTLTRCSWWVLHIASPCW